MRRLCGYSTTVVAAAVLAAPALAQIPLQGRVHEPPRGWDSGARVIQIVPADSRAAERPAIVYLPSPSGGYVPPSNAYPVPRTPAPVVYERIDETQRAREHARYEAEQRRRRAAGMDTRAAEIARARMQAQMELGRASQAADDERRFADEARARILERTPTLNTYERSVTAGDPGHGRDSVSPGLIDAARAREIISGLR